jgi:hypothetical protein
LSRVTTYVGVLANPATKKKRIHTQGPQTESPHSEKNRPKADSSGLNSASPNSVFVGAEEVVGRAGGADVQAGLEVADRQRHSSIGVQATHLIP